LLEKAGFVDDQDRVWGAKVLHHVSAQIVAHGVGIPLRSSEQALHPVGRCLTCDFRDLPAVLAGTRAEQPVQIAECATPWFHAPEVASNPLMECF
jgi:hypothetical protein